MKEGSYLEIEPGMPVVGRDGKHLGVVEEVLEDEGSGIFVGLVIKAGHLFGRPMLLHGEHIERLHEGVVSVDATAEELEPYVSPAEALRERARFESAADDSG
jgi:uncharacterized protein YrrD